MGSAPNPATRGVAPRGRPGAGEVGVSNPLAGGWRVVSGVDVDEARLVVNTYPRSVWLKRCVVRGSAFALSGVEPRNQRFRLLVEREEQILCVQKRTLVFQCVPLGFGQRSLKPLLA